MAKNKEMIMLVAGIIFAIYLILLYNARSIDNQKLTGLYTGSAAFMNAAELDKFILNIDESNYLSNSCDGYIIMVNTDGNIIINNPIRLHFSMPSLMPWTCKYKKYTITIDWLGEYGYDFFPSNQTLHYYPNLGKLVFMDSSETVHGILYKNYEAIDFASSMPDVKELDNDSEALSDE